MPSMRAITPFAASRAVTIARIRLRTGGEWRAATATTRIVATAAPATAHRRRTVHTSLRIRSRVSLLLDASRHVTADFAVLPGAGVPIAVEEEADGEGADAGQAGVGHHDHRRVADEAHRDDDRERFAVEAAARHAGVETPQVVADLFDADDVVAVGPRGAIFPAGDGERADQRCAAHAVA